jgi:hypothetical protein
MCFDAKLNLEKDKCNAWVIKLFVDNNIFKKFPHLSCQQILGDGGVGDHFHRLYIFAWFSSILCSYLIYFIFLLIPHLD